MKFTSAHALKAELSSELDRMGAGQLTPLASMMSTAMGENTKALEPRHLVPQGVAVGIAVGQGNDDYQLALRLQTLSPADTAFASYAKELARHEADVRYIGPIIIVPETGTGVQPYCGEVRPVRPGYSVGHPTVGVGTIGVMVKNNRGQEGLLSNNHILAAAGDAMRRDHIFQPGVTDGGKRPMAIIASFEGSIDLDRQGINVVDAAYALLDHDIEVDPTYDGRPMRGVLGTRDIVKRLDVWKIGRSTGKTHGKVSVVDCDNLMVRIRGRVYQFNDQIEIESDSLFSLGGDSGSAILSDRDEGVGLLFAGPESGRLNGKYLAYANPMETVLKLLHLEPM
ncbi:hypothetical protein D187_004242 [Cystobacter fuscus DSM 2262]|uniref:Peptidase S1 domain-containing protein n=1 Tax=Cystobacter fuscus (strain ATCC 25194 / DSM 2262 / NBRC 100088 / M29) TaxID=1242864 RepID=S9P174_CYSF2|nr:hypothetical protein [Cystobacter fuscus]EPX58205.1 hypothetical protein D187_004242 [Cystobacter fuscus DSM 2262]